MKQSTKVKQDLNTNRELRYPNKEAYSNAKQKQTAENVSSDVLEDILKILKKHCPKVTGYGANHGFKIKEVVVGKKASKYLFDIIVGSEHSAKGGQMESAPYIAIQNIWEYYTGWLESALVEARAYFRKNGMWVQIYAPAIQSKYDRKSASPRDVGGISGYRVRVSLLEFETVAYNKSQGIKRRRR